MTLVIDNYDSFTWNLVQYLWELGEEVEVRRNDEITVDEAVEMGPDRVLISPGPRTPDKAGISVRTIEEFGGRTPVLGVCLGHQSIGQAAGARIVRAERVMHGKTSAIHHDGRGVFSGLPQPFTATRYHSLVVERASIPDTLEVSAWTDQGEVMGLRRTDVMGVEGVQFHPESILTEAGHDLLGNFLALSSGIAP